MKIIGTSLSILVLILIMQGFRWKSGGDSGHFSAFQDNNGSSSSHSGNLLGPVLGLDWYSIFQEHLEVVADSL